MNLKHHVAEWRVALRLWFRRFSNILRGKKFYLVPKDPLFSEFGWSLFHSFVNWGDLLLREGAEKLFNIKSMSRDYYGAVFGGTVLSEEYFSPVEASVDKRPALFVSCGARTHDSLSRIPTNLEIHGVRGFLSSKVIPNSQAVGDPGMLFPVLFDVAPKTTKHFKHLWIPHFTQKALPSGNRYEIHSTLLPRGNSAQSLAKTISSASFVLTGSLHVGIIAYSTGTPFAFSMEKNKEGEFKYLDFASFHNLKLEFKNDFGDAIDWYIHEESMNRELSISDYDVYSKSLSKYLKISEKELLSKIGEYCKVRNIVHARKLNMLRNLEPGEFF